MVQSQAAQISLKCLVPGSQTLKPMPGPGSSEGSTRHGKS